jgi:S-DNA-T family DNA segregation ATPase FtsK/SpoIIIE
VREKNPFFMKKNFLNNDIFVEVHEEDCSSIVSTFIVSYWINFCQIYGEYNLKQVRSSRKRVQTAKVLQVGHHLYECLFILSMAVAVYLFVALVSYHHADPGWSSTGEGLKVANSGGKVGAFLADLFLCIFGYMAYLFPVVFIVPAWISLRRLLLKQTLYGSSFLWRLFGFILVLLAGCGVMDLYWQHLSAHIPLKSGGILGNLLSSGLMIAFNFIGTSIVLIAAVLIGVVLLTGISWLSMFQAIIGNSIKFYQWAREWCLNCYTAICEKKFPILKESKPVEAVKTRVQHEADEPLVNMDAFQQVQIEEIALLDVPDINEVPSLSLLNSAQKSRKQSLTESKLSELSQEVEEKLLDFGIEAKVVAVYPGPVITRFELELAPGLKVSKITALAKDLARSLSQSSVRVVEVIPGKSVIGLEIPNEYRELVYLKELLESEVYVNAKSPLSLALGKDISGYPVVVDLAKMPHLLVAGTTGSGKSVSLNSMLFSLLFKATPKEVRFIMIDPKMLELSVYEGIPHLMTPVVTDMREAANAFKWSVVEMDRRYQLMASLGVRNLVGFNSKVVQAIDSGQPIPDPFAPDEAKIDDSIPTLKPLPYIVVVVDELADMMMVVGKKVEELIARIAQKARAAGIHMILSTQRPSVDVITGLIKANIPTRIAFQVSSRIDSRTILDQQGAEQLLGYGDMLYLPPGAGLPIRIHGAFVSDDEVHKVVASLRKLGQPEYIQDILKNHEAENSIEEEADAEQDPLYDQAVKIVVESRRASISYVQRRLKIGYNRAARILESMEQAGVVSEMEGSGVREVLVPKIEGDE